MEQKNKQGFLLYAFGNKDLDYGKLALCCALSIKSNLKINHTTVILDKGTKKWLEQNTHPEIIDSAFDNIIRVEENFTSGKRRHFDSPWVSFKAEFNNQHRILSYEYTPYDETILIDVDYLVMSNQIDNVWSTTEDVLINQKAIDLQGNKFGDIEDQRLSRYGIPLYWATLVYFRKSKISEMFFDLINYVREEYNFFQFLYDFKKGFYRNDYSFSIATHILSGFIKGGIKPFPNDTLTTSYQQDGIAKVISSEEIIFIANNRDEQWKNTLVNAKGFDVHVMNKRELLRVGEKFIDLCMEKL